MGKSRPDCYFRTSCLSTDITKTRLPLYLFIKHFQLPVEKVSTVLLNYFVNSCVIQSILCVAFQAYTSWSWSQKIYYSSISFSNICFLAIEFINTHSCIIIEGILPQRKNPSLQKSSVATRFKASCFLWNAELFRSCWGEIFRLAYRIGVHPASRVIWLVSDCNRYSRPHILQRLRIKCYYYSVWLITFVVLRLKMRSTLGWKGLPLNGLFR